MLLLKPGEAGNPLMMEPMEVFSTEPEDHKRIHPGSFLQKNHENQYRPGTTG